MAARQDALAKVTAEPPASRESLFDRLRRWRLRLVADPAFRRRIAASPLAFMGRRKGRELFGVVTGFVRSQILFAALETGLIDLLATGPLDTARAAAALGLPEAQAIRLLRPAGAVGLIEQDRKGRWWLTDSGAVVAGDPGIAAMIRHHALLYRDLADPVALLRDPALPTHTQDLWAYVRGGQDTPAPPLAGDYSRLMTASQNMLIDEMLAAYDFGKHKRLLDVGGGEGALVKAIGARHTDLRLGLFDLPAVVALAGGSDGIERAGGDFFRDPLPAGADCITLLRVVCDHEDRQVVRLLRNIAAALAPGGVLVIGEQMDGEGEDNKLLAAYFGFYFMAMRSGRCRTPDEIGALLGEAGFAPDAPLRSRNPLAGSVMTARLTRRV